MEFLEARFSKTAKGWAMRYESLASLNTYLKEVKSVEGYVQPIDGKIGFYSGGEVEREPYELAFWDGSKSVTIRFLNGAWYLDESDFEGSIGMLQKGEIPKENTLFYVEGEDELSYVSVLEKKRAKFRRVWQMERDELCEGLGVPRLKKVVFVGFGGE
jgi:CRISPR type III-associated protein (TIGR04423 family)